MAANRIKGITVEIGGDTTKLSEALKGINKEIKNTQSQLCGSNPDFYKYWQSGLRDH